MSRKGLAAALLLAALSARAQMEARTAVVLPQAAGPAVLAPSAVLAPALSPSLGFTAAPALAAALPALSAAPAAALRVALPAPAAAAALPPIEARAAAMNGALAEFGKTDLKSASAGEARDAGDSLMLRALGAAPAEAVPAGSDGVFASVPGEEGARLVATDGGSPSRAQPQIYLLSKPLRETVKLGPVALVAHAAFAVLWELAKAAVAWKATGSFAAAATVFAFESTTSPVMLSARSLGDLGFRYWRRKLGVLKELARTPGITRVKVLTTAEVSFWGPFARRAENTGLIFVEAARDLPEVLGRFGAPLALGDVGATKVRLNYVQGGETSDVSWMPSLKELLDGRPIPPETAAAWRAGASGSKPALVKMIDVTGAKGKARLEATLIGADGRERDIGAISEGPAARRLIGLGPLDRARAFLGRPRPLRAIPISDSTIERPGDAREPGLAASLRRAWRRMTGRVIVAR